MRKIFFGLGCIALLASCQKEVSFDLNNPAAPPTTGGGSTGGGSTGTGLLIKAVGVTGSETVTTTYTYDASKRLATQTDLGVGGLLPINNYRRFERDAAGRIVRIVQKLGDVMGVPSDTARHTIHYPNSTTMDPDYSVNVVGMDMGGFPMKTFDSSVYHYTGGKLTSWDTYFSSEMAGVPVPGGINGRWELTYDAANRVSVQKNFNDGGTGGPITEFVSQKFTYGTQAQYVYTSTSPMQNYLMHGSANSAANVVTKFESNSTATTPPSNVVVTTTYTVGSGGKVTTASATQTQTGQPTRTTNYTFTYQ